ncbi:MAG: hypothetical protein HYU97_05755 [Deltaproteobacteria bacterium]|nr:hypothetical protein [Deltaproteobacteria bacterium]
MYKFMNKYLIILMGWLIMPACGGGEFTDISSDLSMIQGDLSGDYQARDSNCTGFALGDFTILQEGFNLTVLIQDPAKDSNLKKGDRFTGQRTIKQNSKGDSYYAFESETLGCNGFILDTQSKVDLATDSVLVKFQTGDLLLTCFDSSADGACDLSFARKLD